MESDSVSESGKIYRNHNGMFCFLCVHCGNYFENVDETLVHIESHFSDGTVSISNDETSEIDNKPEGYTDSLEFISITTNNLKVESETRRDDAGTENWLDENSINSRKTNINCSHCSESFQNQLYLVLHSEIHHPDQPIEGVTNNDVQCDRCLMQFDSNEKLEEHLTKDHTMEVTIDLKVDNLSSFYDLDECLECKVCRRTFKAKHLLNRHLHRSTCKDEFCIPLQVGEFPFYCDICGHGFSHKFRLIHHMSQRHSGKENRCKYCGQRYVFETSLLKHETYECFQRPAAEEYDERNIDSTRGESSNATHGSVKKTWGGYREPKNIQGPKMFNCQFCDKVYDTH